MQSTSWLFGAIVDWHPSFEIVGASLKNFYAQMAIAAFLPTLIYMLNREWRVPNYF